MVDRPMVTRGLLLLSGNVRDAVRQMCQLLLQQVHRGVSHLVSSSPSPNAAITVAHPPH